MGNPLPKGHIATSEGEINAHGRHADLIAPTEFGSHQIRIDSHGRYFSDSLNFSNRFMDDRHGFMANGMPDPRGTGHGGYNR